MTIQTVLEVFQAVMSAFEAPIFLAFTLMIAVSVAFGIKRILIE